MVLVVGGDRGVYEPLLVIERVTVLRRFVGQQRQMTHDYWSIFVAHAMVGYTIRCGNHDCTMLISLRLSSGGIPAN